MTTREMLSLAGRAGLDSSRVKCRPFTQHNFRKLSMPHGIFKLTAMCREGRDDRYRHSKVKTSGSRMRQRRTGRHWPRNARLPL